MNIYRPGGGSKNPTRTTVVVRNRRPKSAVRTSGRVCPVKIGASKNVLLSTVATVRSEHGHRSLVARLTLNPGDQVRWKERVIILDDPNNDEAEKYPTMTRGHKMDIRKMLHEVEQLSDGKDIVNALRRLQGGHTRTQPPHAPLSTLDVYQKMQINGFNWKNQRTYIPCSTEKAGICYSDHECEDYAMHLQGVCVADDKSTHFGYVDLSMTILKQVKAGGLLTWNYNQSLLRRKDKDETNTVLGFTCQCQHCSRVPRGQF